MSDCPEAAVRALCQDCGHLADDDRDLFSVLPAAVDLAAQYDSIKATDTLLIWCVRARRTECHCAVKVASSCTTVCNTSGIDLDHSLFELSLTSSAVCARRRESNLLIWS